MARPKKVPAKVPAIVATQGDDSNPVDTVVADVAEVTPIVPVDAQELATLYGAHLLHSDDVSLTLSRGDVRVAVNIEDGRDATIAKLNKYFG